MHRVLCGYPLVSVGDWFQDPLRYQNPGCPSPLHKIVQYLHVIHTHPPVQFEPSLDYL